MQENEIAHYCQKCLAANSLGQDFCFRCGTRLMIVVEPASMRYDTPEASGAVEEDMLERVSVLENRLGRLTERMERALDLLLRQAQNSYLDRALLKSLIGLLDADGVVENQKLERVWQQRCEQDAAAQEQSNRRVQLRAKITASYRGGDRRGFEQLVSEGFQLLESQNVSGTQLLRRAAEKDPQNTALLSFLGEQFFRTGKMKLARQFLSKVLEVSPEDNHVLLLLGLACGDEGETEQAKHLLETTTRRAGSSFAAHYGLGKLFFAEQKWPKAVREFKRALASKPSPEAHYALGCVYYQLGRDGLAVRYLLKAVEMDTAYSEAFQLLGLVYRRGGNLNGAHWAFERAGITESLLTGAERKMSFSKGEQAEPKLFQTGGSKLKRLMTGGDVRLANALREDALKVFVTAKE